MAQRTLGVRVDSLEKTVGTLEHLPAHVGHLDERVGRVEVRIVELRTEMRDGFSVIREEMATKAEAAALRDEMHTGFTTLKAELIEHADRGDKETRRYMRTLFEEYVGRFRVTREGDPEP